MIYRPTVTRRRSDGTKVATKSGTWRQRFEHPVTGKRIDLTLKTRDKSAALILAGENERRAALEFAGKADKYEEHGARPLSEHIDDWIDTLLGGDRGPGYVKQTKDRALSICEFCKFKVWGDITSADVLRYSKHLRDDEGLKTKTRNDHLAAIKQVTRWMQNEKRAPSNPLAGMEELTITDAEERGAFTADEMRRLLAAVDSGPTRRKVPGKIRRLLYQLAVETGFRYKECRTLTWADLDLDAATPSARVVVRRAKDKRTYHQPLKPGMVGRLWAWWGECGEPGPKADVFPSMPDHRHAAEMIRVDMKLAGIPLEDAKGNKRGFHSLRHTFGTLLARAGVRPKQAMEAMRHKNINLTMKLYTHTYLQDQAEAVGSLPDLDVGAESMPEPVAGVA